jgi:hypothetical protein
VRNYQGPVVARYSVLEDRENKKDRMRMEGQRERGDNYRNEEHER